jgi:hypothetical protein
LQFFCFFLQFFCFFLQFFCFNHEKTWNNLKQRLKNANKNVKMHFYTHSAYLNLFSNFPTSPVWGWHTPYFPGNSASYSLNFMIEERGVNETRPLRHTPFPYLIVTSTSEILHKLMYWSYSINEDLDQISTTFL